MAEADEFPRPAGAPLPGGPDTPPPLVFAESAEPRVLEAALRLDRAGEAAPWLVGDPPPEWRERLRREGSRIRIVRPGGERLRRLAAFLRHRSSANSGAAADSTDSDTGADRAEAEARDPLFFADWLVATGEAAGAIAGARATTAEVVRAALRTIGPRPGVRRISGAFLMEFPDSESSDRESPGSASPRSAARRPPLLFTDGAVIPEPGVADLAEIALLAADAAKTLLDEEPRVAMLSFSTRGSADHPKARRMAEAAERVRRLRPDLPVDGELQADAALVPEIASRKAPGSPVAGRANVLVFPDLASGNLAYKLVERLAGATATGPLLLGLAAPANDLSRGAGVEDLVRLARLTLRQARDREASGAAAPLPLRPNRL